MNGTADGSLRVWRFKNGEQLPEEDITSPKEASDKAGKNEIPSEKPYKGTDKDRKSDVSPDGLKDDPCWDLDKGERPGPNPEPNCPEKTPDKK